MKLLAARRLNVVTTEVNDKVTYDEYNCLNKNFNNCVSITENTDSTTNRKYYHITVDTENGYAYYDLFVDEYILSII